MTDTLADLVQQTRSMLQGTLADEASLLAEDYIPGSGQIVLKYPKRNVIVGSILSCGLNTFYVLEASSNAQNLVVLPGYDGGPDQPVSKNEVVRLRPIYSNWAIYRELSQEIQEMSSPQHGLWYPQAWEYTRNWTDDTYPWPVTTPIQVPAPLRLVRGRFQIPGTQAWGTIQNAEWMPEMGMTRVRSSVSDANVIELTYAMEFVMPPVPDLTLDLDSIGLTGNLRNIPALGASAALALAGEGRRMQPFAQGDPRRAEEVTAGMNVGVSRMWESQKRDMIAAELARLTREFGWAMAMPEPRPHWRIGGGYPGGGVW